MAWSAPMTAVANAVFTAAQFNQYVRDNLNECPAAKVTATSDYVVGTGPNAMAVRTLQRLSEDVIVTTTSTSYTTLGTGPNVTATTGTKCLVGIYSYLDQNTVSNSAFASYAVSGATTIASNDNVALMTAIGSAASARCIIRASSVQYQLFLTAGSNTFTMQYRVTGGTGTYDGRRIFVMPF